MESKLDLAPESIVWPNAMSPCRIGIGDVKQDAAIALVAVGPTEIALSRFISRRIVTAKSSVWLKNSPRIIRYG